jgi:hypothetical protein
MTRVIHSSIHSSNYGNIPEGEIHDLILYYVSIGFDAAFDLLSNTHSIYF